MKTKNYTLYALGLAAAISLVAGNAAAQARSDTRIPVRKDAPPVEAPRVDTVRIVSKPDTVIIRGRTDTVVRTVTLPVVHDTVMQLLPLAKLPGLYFGVGVGPAIPTNNWTNSAKEGWDLNGHVGWFPANGNLGVRADVNYAMLNTRQTGCLGCPDTRLLSGLANLVWRIPLDQRSKVNPVFYLMGGGSLDKFTDFIPYRNTDGRVVVAGEATNITNPQSTALGVTAANRGTKNWHYGWNVGGGIEMTIVGLHWFAESRFASVRTTGGNSHYVPIIGGLRFY